MTSPGGLSIDAARRDFAAAIGASHVIDDPAARRVAETATFATDARVPLIVRPGSRDDVQACLQVARRHGLTVYPISTGRNWGYGSSVPSRDGAALLDLRRMQRIVDFDERLGYVTIEPGVTQQQLFDFLRVRQSRLWMDATGAGPDTSVVGNTLERGFGHTPYGDHAAHACAFEVVLADGSCVTTGMGRFPSAAAAPIYRWGVGPVLDGLFTQSNFGVVTRMTVWLMPAPEQFTAFFFRCEEHQPLAPLVEALRPLKMHGVLRSALHIGNDYKVLNGLSQYPWALTGGATPLQPSHMRALRGRLRIGVWNGSGALYGTPAQVADGKRRVRQALRGTATGLQFLDDRRLALARRLAGPYRLLTGWDLRATLALLEPVYGLLQGRPTSATLTSAYWRKRTPPPADMDPDRDRCGLLWCAPVAPLDGEPVARLTTICVDRLLHHGFEPLLSLTAISERAMTCVVSIAYDRDVEGEDARALACYHDLVETLAAAGYYSYRMALAGQPSLAQGTAYDSLLRTIKRALDPHGLLAPGRYGIDADDDAS